jgi:hypothetical protein
MWTDFNIKILPLLYNNLFGILIIKKLSFKNDIKRPKDPVPKLETWSPIVVNVD